MTNRSSVDVVVVGGGVAGSSAAIVLRRLGLDVLLAERSPTFRDRVRGEGIHPWGIAEAERLGLLPTVLAAGGAHPLPVWQSYADREAEEPYHWARDAVGGHVEHGVFHPRLQEALLADAKRVGVAVRRPAAVAAITSAEDVGEAASASVAAIESVGERPAAEGRRYDRIGDQRVVLEDGESISCRLVVGADGARSLTRRLAGIAARSDPPHHRFGGVRLAGVDLDRHAGHEATFPGGRLFVLPQGDGHARAYVAVSPERHDALTPGGGALDILGLCRVHLPEAGLHRASVAGPSAFFPNPDTWAATAGIPGVALVGDAAGANDPSVGHGLSLTWRDVRALRDAVETHGLGPEATAAYAAGRPTYLGPLRHHAAWLATLVTEEGDEADARRDAYAAARETDPTAGGFRLIFARGPEGLVADEAARARFFGGVPVVSRAPARSTSRTPCLCRGEGARR